MGFATSLGFVTGVGICDIWVGFVMGFVIIFRRHTWVNQLVLPRTFCAVCRLFVTISVATGFCHFFGRCQWGWNLSHMGGFCHFFGICPWAWNLSHMGGFWAILQYMHMEILKYLSM